jgi:hypothetical protein
VRDFMDKKDKNNVIDFAKKNYEPLFKELSDAEKINENFKEMQALSQALRKNCKEGMPESEKANAIEVCRKTSENGDFRNFVFNDINNLQILTDLGPFFNVIKAISEWNQHRIVESSKLEEEFIKEWKELNAFMNSNPGVDPESRITDLLEKLIKLQKELLKGNEILSATNTIMREIENLIEIFGFNSGKKNK